MKAKKVRKWLLKKNGKKQHYWVYKKKLEKEREWDKHLKAWKLKIDLNQIKKDMLQLFEQKAMQHYKYFVDKDGTQKKKFEGGIKGYDNMHFKKELDNQLQNSQIQYEGDDWYQINGYTGTTANSAKVKVRYNTKQKLLEVTIRDYKVE